MLVHQSTPFDAQSPRVGVLHRRAVELLHTYGWLLVAQGHVTQEPPDPAFLVGQRFNPNQRSQWSTRPMIETALKHMTSVTRMMCSVHFVFSAADSNLCLPRVSVVGSLRFQRYGVLVLSSSKTPRHSRPNSDMQNCEFHCRVSRHSQHMSMTVSTCVVRRFFFFAAVRCVSVGADSSSSRSGSEFTVFQWFYQRLTAEPPTWPLHTHDSSWKRRM